jgi:hypothetical protein
MMFAATCVGAQTTKCRLDADCLPHAQDDVRPLEPECRGRVETRRLNERERTKMSKMKLADILDRIGSRSAGRREPLLERGGRTQKLRWIAPPAPQASFGYVNDWVAVTSGAKGGPTSLIVPFEATALGWIRPGSLRMFRFDAETRRFELVEGSRIHPRASAVYASITRPGTYGIVGLHGHPLVQETIRLFCDLRTRFEVLPEAGRDAFRDRICDLVLCARDMKGFLESRGELERLVGTLEDDMPTGMPSLISRPAFSGETICDRCHGAGGIVTVLPECTILEEPPQRGPCRQARWENVGPRHISGAMRQVVIDPNVRTRLYAVSANGGIWRLTNVDGYPNSEWRPLTDGETNLRFRTMAVAPGDSNVLYAANITKIRPYNALTVFSEIYRSDNRGLDWGASIHRPGMGVVHRLVVHPFNPDVVFAATSTGLWLQSVMPGSWTALFAGDCLDVAIDPGDSSIVYLGVRGVGLFKSFTSGATWPGTPILAFNPTTTSDDPTTGAVEANQRQAIKIALGRRNLDGTEQTPASRTVVARFGNQVNVHQAGGDDPAGWLQVVPSQIVPNPNPTAARPTIDAALDKLAGGNFRRCDTLPTRSNEWINCLAVDPFDANHIFVASVGVLESTDGGGTWSVREDFAHEDNHSIAFDEEVQGLVYVSNDGGLFSSADGGATWPSMSLADTDPSVANKANLAKGLVTSEFRGTALRLGRCLAAIDHTGFILSEDFDNRWQFLFSGPDRSAKHAHEGSRVFACPASLDRYYIFNNRGGANGDDPTGVRGRLAQFDFTRTGNLVDRPAFSFLTSGLATDLPGFILDQGTFFPEDDVYDRLLPGPFAIRFREADDERLILYGTVDQPGVGFTIQSLRLPTDGTAVTAAATEGTSASAFCAIVFAPFDNRAFAITQDGQLFERDFSDANGQFILISQMAFPAGDIGPSCLVPVMGPELRIYALSRTMIGRYDDDGLPMTPICAWPNPNQERLMSLVAHPSRDGTFFLGTNRGVYISENDGADWGPYRLGMPSVPITHLSFDQGFLYAGTYGRGLWRCKPCR